MIRRMHERSNRRGDFYQIFRFASGTVRCVMWMYVHEVWCDYDLHLPGDTRYMIKPFDKNNIS